MKKTIFVLSTIHCISLLAVVYFFKSSQSKFLTLEDLPDFSEMVSTQSQSLLSPVDKEPSKPPEIEVPGYSAALNPSGKWVMSLGDGTGAYTLGDQTKYGRVIAIGMEGVLVRSYDGDKFLKRSTQGEPVKRSPGLLGFASS